MSLASIKKEFPIFKRRVNGKLIAYLDNASTTQKPQVVIDALARFYQTMNANIHRGIHTLSEESTEAYEATRKRVAVFINAKHPEEIVFTRNATEGINLVAQTWGKSAIGRGDEVIVSAYEHHANLVPWQELCRQQRARLKVIPLRKDLSLDMRAYERLLSSKTKLVCITAQSNVLGIIPPLKEIIRMAHEVGARVLVDGAQSAGHTRTNVQKLGCDFFVLSSHKMAGPTGVGVLYGKQDLLDSMPPFLFGGDMVVMVGKSAATYREAPWRFEPGTPNIAGVVAFSSALDFLDSIGLETIQKHEKKLFLEARKRFLSFPEMTLFPSGGVSYDCNSILSFDIKGVHPHDVATIFDVEGVAIRSGLHCAEPLVRSLGVPATSRISFYLYNDLTDIDRAEKALEKVLRVFRKR